MSVDWREYIPFGSDPTEQLVAGLDGILGDGDAIALLPYDDGTFYMKRAYFDKELIGGIGGFETDDGDKIAVDGAGEAVRSLFGVPVVLGVDPTEHAAAVDPIKAVVAHKDDIGEWVRVDRQGAVVQVGPALDPAPVINAAADADEAFDVATDDELLTLYYDHYDPREYSAREKRDLVDEHEAAIREQLADIYSDDQPELEANGMVGDGGMVTDFQEQAHKERHSTMSFEEALRELAERGDVTKVYDIAPPAGMYLDPQGEARVEEATHIAVDQSKAADLLPTTWDTVELNTALDKARMEEHEEGKLMKYFVYGMVAMGVMALVLLIVMFLLFQIGGGIF